MSGGRLCPQVLLFNLIVAATLVVCHGESSSPENVKNLIPVDRLKKIAEHVNSLDLTWKAEVNSVWLKDDATLLDLNHLTGTFDPNLTPKFRINKSNAESEDDDDSDESSQSDSDESSQSEDESDEEKKKEKKEIQCENNGLPKNFDARQHWPECKSISHIYDQGNCGSCWAVSVASAFTDRVCIQSKAKHTELRSAQQILSCAHKASAKDGCNGGWPAGAFDYIRRNGLSTGGDYNTNEGCQPYRIKPCSHRINSTKLPLCSSTPAETAHKCKLHCYNSKYRTAYKKDRIKVKEVYEVDPCAAQNEIYKHGPIVAPFAVYEDFVTYKSGVYQYTTGNIIGWHAVRVIGWGEEKGTPYWLVTNSWNENWGDNGYFKTIRGSPGNGWFDERLVACSIDL